MKITSKYDQHNMSLLDLVEFLEERTQNPVLLETTDFELITYSGNYQLLDDVRKNTILDKKAPLYIIDCLTEEKVVETIESSHEPIRLPCIPKIDFTERVVFCIREENISIAYLWVQEANRKLTEEDFNIITSVGEEIAIKMKQDHRPAKSTDQRLLTKLLEGQYTSEKMLLFEAEMSGITLPLEFVIIIFYVPENKLLNRLLKYIRSYCFYENEYSMFVKNENHVTLLMGRGEKMEEDLYSMADRLIEKNVKQKNNANAIFFGISNKSRNLLELHSHYHEALEVINIHKSFREPNISYYYPKLGIYSLLPSIQEKYTKEGYINTIISDLERYDLANHTALLPTLEKYITLNCKGVETAEALFIHPNTLSYRLKKVVLLTNIDFDDMNMRTTLYIDLLLQSYK
ncbi:PucR family transcriptional regulator [Aquibacillus rhizosphaerae]|uniref:Helix-turn-helix domain-containing protein n=1 Tax=Aquibacillus rhizosphaerae TaxID=3051431 RepID=A0ABT7LD78_9BACI|nr:helix-turn-helix domain-containing protein [Aquibacillus sp. LR5S19]MDL4843217.1 helix-turn-helix domain-containing protein [Aquibacillus sp. LR5S19]